MRSKFIIGLILGTVVLITVIGTFWNLIYTGIPLWYQKLPVGLQELVDPFPEIRPFLWTIGAIVFFFLYELATILVTDKKIKPISSRQSINLFMGLKVGKFILALTFALIYAIAVKVELKHFLIVFAVLYLIYLAFDTFYFLSVEKKLKKEDGKK
ncbi:MAG: hypothetical protein FWD60_13685 [Candidatus Azobacteroides sp.]|nr:hypothetical protein [Candidatus Azobacteroides sp.]